MSFKPFKKPTGVLGELVGHAREDCAARKRTRPDLPGEVARTKTKTRGFRRALQDRATGFPLICEVKRASPSAGSIRPIADAASVALVYEHAGASCVSVLTEGRRFGGSLDDLRAVSGAVGIPVLRKDFVVDQYMIYEAAEAGADAVLLIVAAVEPACLAELAVCAAEVGLDALIEITREDEIDIVEMLKAQLVGVNARDLETLLVDKDRFARIAPKMKHPDRLLVAESGISEPADIARVAAACADAALVGEALMRSSEPGGLLRALRISA